MTQIWLVVGMRLLPAVIALLFLVGCTQSIETQNEIAQTDSQSSKAPGPQAENGDSAKQESGEASEKDGADLSPEAPLSEVQDSDESAAEASKGVEVTRGLIEVSLFHGGVDREALLYVPETYDHLNGAPLMLNFHGFSLDANTQLQLADMRSLADRDGFLLAYPQGTELGGYPFWNALPVSEDKNKSSVDDLGFVRDLIAQIESSYPLDRSRIYASGFSNGGMMAYALACYERDLVAAVGVVSGQLLDGENCAPESPTAVIKLHGTNDRVLPYNGGYGQLSVQDAIDFWVTHNETATSPQVEVFTQGGTTIERQVYGRGKNGVAVEHYKYLEGEHDWFRQRVEGLDASELLWNFVSRYSSEGLLAGG